MSSETDARHSWERREDESTKAYAAFCAYRDLGIERSFDKAYRAVKGAEKRAVTGRWKLWANVYEWRRRAQDYDLYLELQARQRREAEHHAELEAYRMRQKHLAQATTDSALKMLKLGNQKIEDLQKQYDDWKAALLAADSPELRAKLLANDPISVLSVPNWIRAAASAAQVATDAESQALAVNELLHMLDDSKQ